MIKYVLASVNNCSICFFGHQMLPCYGKICFEMFDAVSIGYSCIGFLYVCMFVFLYVCDGEICPWTVIYSFCGAGSYEQYNSVSDVDDKKNEERGESNEGTSVAKSKRRFPDFG